MRKVILTVLLCFVAISTHGATYNILGGSFYIQDVTASPIILTSSQQITDGSYVTGTALSYYGEVVDTVRVFDDFEFFGAATPTTFTQRPSNSAPTIDLVNMTADFRSFTWWWCGCTEVPAGAIATLTDEGGFYRASWSSIIQGGGFNGLTSEFTMDIQAVPVPSALLLFLPGLISLLLISKRTIHA